MQKTQVQSLGWEGNPLQYARLENSMNSGAWQATAHGVAKSRTSKLLTHTVQGALFTASSLGTLTQALPPHHG